MTVMTLAATSLAVAAPARHNSSATNRHHPNDHYKHRYRWSLLAGAPFSQPMWRWNPRSLFLSIIVLLVIESLLAASNGPIGGRSPLGVLIQGAHAYYDPSSSEIASDQNERSAMAGSYMMHDDGSSASPNVANGGDEDDNNNVIGSHSASSGGDSTSSLSSDGAAESDAAEEAPVAAAHHARGYQASGDDDEEEESTGTGATGGSQADMTSGGISSMVSGSQPPASGDEFVATTSSFAEPPPMAATRQPISFFSASPSQSMHHHPHHHLEHHHDDYHNHHHHNHHPQHQHPNYQHQHLHPMHPMGPLQHHHSSMINHHHQNQNHMTTPPEMRKFFDSTPGILMTAGSPVDSGGASTGSSGLTGAGLSGGSPSSSTTVGGAATGPSGSTSSTSSGSSSLNGDEAESPESPSQHHAAAMNALFQRRQLSQQLQAGQELNPLALGIPGSPQPTPFDMFGGGPGGPIHPKPASNSIDNGLGPALPFGLGGLPGLAGFHTPFDGPQRGDQSSHSNLQSMPVNGGDGPPNAGGGPSLTASGAKVWPKIFRFTDGRINLSDFEKQKKIRLNSKNLNTHHLENQIDSSPVIFDGRPLRRKSFLILHGGIY